MKQKRGKHNQKGGEGHPNPALATDAKANNSRGEAPTHRQGSVDDTKPSRIRMLFSPTGWTALATVAIAVTTILYTIYSQKQWRSMQDSLELARTQMRISVRPFVDLDEGSDAIQTTALHIDEAGNARLVYIIRAKNYSNSPASNVWAYANLVVADDLYTVYEQQDYACGDAVVGKPDIGLILFQGRDRVLHPCLV